MFRLIFLLTALVSVTTAGCQSGPIGSRLFAKTERTSYLTPQKRVDEAYGIAAQANGENTPEQQELVVDLAQRLVTEPDPLVRESIMQAIAKFNTPTVNQVLLAGLNDSEPAVRQRCCRAIGLRRQTDAVAALQQLASSNQEEIDVRHEATRALGQIGSPEALQALAVALEDHDPGVQLVGLEAASRASGRDFGNDVGAALAYVQGDAPAVATRPTDSPNGLRRWLPF